MKRRRNQVNLPLSLYKDCGINHPMEAGEHRSASRSYAELLVMGFQTNGLPVPERFGKGKKR